MPYSPRMRSWVVAGVVLVSILIPASPPRAESIPRSKTAAVATTATRASLSPDGPWLPSAARADWPLEVHDTSGPRLQIVERSGGVELWLYIDRATLRDVALPGAELRPGTGSGPRGERDPGVTLEPGTTFEQAAPAANHRVRVKVRIGGLGEELQVTGYVSADAIGTLYLVSPDATRGFSYDVKLPVRYQLRDAPGGRVFATASNRERADAELLVRERGSVLVRTKCGAVGWVAASQVQDNPVPMTSFGGGWATLLTSTAEPETLPIGTALFDAVNGRAVGAVGAGFDYAPVKQEGEWQSFAIQSPFGAVELWARATATPRSPKPPVPRGTLDLSRAPTGELGGRPLAEIQHVVKTRSGLLRACYQRELRNQPDLAGDVVVDLSIARDGKVSRAQIDASQTTLASESLVHCVTNTMSRLRFPGARADSELSYPLTFSSSQAP
jgi:hypothetical protein